MRQSILLIVGLFLLPFALTAQPWMKDIPQEKLDNQTFTFQEVQKAFNDYWSGREIVRGNGYKQFRRWEHKTARSLDANGNFRHNLYLKALNEKNAKDNGTKLGNWENLGPNEVPLYLSTGDRRGLGRVNTVAFHPTDNNILYLGTPGGGVWKSIDAGVNWTTTTDQLPVLGVSDIAIDQQNPNNIYVATGDADAADTYSAGIYKSTDDGDTWAATGLTQNLASGLVIKRILMDPDNALTQIALTSSGVLKTTDGWNTYEVKKSGNFRDGDFKPGDYSTMYATTFGYFGGATIYRSTNGGENWSASISGMNIGSNSNRIEVAVTPANPEVVYALCSNGSTNGLLGVYKSTNSGSSWTQVADQWPNLLCNDWNTVSHNSQTDGQGWFDLALAVSPTNEDLVVVGGINAWRSTNGGVSWEYSSHWLGNGGVPYVHADQHTLAFRADGTLYSGNDGGIYKSTNNGQTWQDISDGICVLQIYKFSVDQQNEGRVITGNQDNGSFLRGADNEWDAVYGGDGMECIIDFENPNILYASIYNGDIKKSISGGNGWSSIAPSGQSENGAWVTPYLMHPSNHNMLFSGYSKVYRTTNAGSSWTAISHEIATGYNRILTLAVAPSSTNYIYAGTTSTIYVNETGGSTSSSNWRVSTGTGAAYSRPITYITVANNDPEKVYCTLGGYSDGYKVSQSTDAGETWTNISYNLPATPVHSIVYYENSNDLIFVSTELGVYYKDATMTEWIDFSDGMPNTPIRELEINYTSGKLMAATYGRGVWQTDLPMVASFSADNNTITHGTTVNFSDLSPGEPISWTWTFEGGTPATSTDQNPTVTYETPGLYDVSLTITNSLAETTTNVSEMITVTPVVDFEADIETLIIGNPVSFTDISTGGVTSWAWEFESGTPETSTEQNPTVTYDEAGTFNVSLTATVASTTGDVEETERKTNFIGVTTAIDEVEYAKAKVYPNPAVDFVTIELQDASKDVVIKLYDNSGKLVEFVDAAKVANNKYQINISGLANGIYLVKISTENGDYNRKISIRK